MSPLASKNLISAERDTRETMSPTVSMMHNARMAMLRPIRAPDDENLRKLLSIKAFEDSSIYSINNISKKWINALISLINREYISVASSDKEHIDVVIPTKNNLEILDECLKSFKNSTLNETIYIVDNGEGVQDLVAKYGIPYEVKNL